MLEYYRAFKRARAFSIVKVAQVKKIDVRSSWDVS